MKDGKKVFEKEIARTNKSKLRVTLINWTPKPVETVYLALRNQHFPVPNDLSKIKLNDKEKNEFLDMLLKQHHTSVFEYISTVWLIEGASRAFQQQLTRTRDASYSIQSLRIVNVGSFADNELYHVPEKIEKSEKMLAEYKDAMHLSQVAYNCLIGMGANPEDARGVLPLNVCSPITMEINMRSLIGLMQNRLCLLTQGEFREVAAMMRAEVIRKIHPKFAVAMVPPCVTTGKCPMIIHCGKMPYPQVNSVDVGRWIKDKTKRDEKGRVVKNW